MDNQPIIIERIYHAPVERVWKAITDPRDMKHWYFDLPGFRAEPGYTFQFVGGKDDRSYLHLCEVKEVIVNRKLSYTWKYEKEPGESLVTWELFPEGENTRLKLTHSGLETFDSGNPDLEKHNFVEGWTGILGESLKKYLELNTKPVL